MTHESRFWAASRLSVRIMYDVVGFFKTYGPLRAILAGADTEYDRQKLKELEEEAREIRSNLSDLQLRD